MLDSSKTVYVELWDQHRQLKKEMALLVNNGSSIGAFPIDTSIKAGPYYLRAYTTTGQSFDPVIDFKKSVLIEKNGVVPTGKIVIHSPTTKGYSIPVQFKIDSLNESPSGESQVSIYLTTPDTIDASVSIVDASVNYNTDSNLSILTFKTQPGAIYKKIASTNAGYLDFQGSVEHWHSLKRKPNNISGFLTTAEKQRTILSFPIDSSGHFILNDLLFFNDAVFQYSVNGPKINGTESVQIKIDPRNIPPLSFENDSLYIMQAPYEVAHLTRASADTFTADDFNMVTVKAKPNFKHLDSIYTSNAFSFPSDYGFDLRNEKKFRNIFEYLRFNLAGFSYSGPTFQMIKFRGEPVSFYLDEMEISAADLLNQVGDRIDQIAYVKIYLSFSKNKTEGVGPLLPAIAVYRKKGTDLLTTRPSLNKIVLHGYSPFMKFPDNPDISKGTLFWNPAIEVIPIEDITRLVFRFRRPPGDKKVILRLEGIDRKGRILYFKTIL